MFLFVFSAALQDPFTQAPTSCFNLVTSTPDLASVAETLTGASKFPTLKAEAEAEALAADTSQKRKKAGLRASDTESINKRALENKKHERRGARA